MGGRLSNDCKFQFPHKNVKFLSHDRQQGTGDSRWIVQEPEREVPGNTLI